MRNIPLSKLSVIRALISLELPAETLAMASAAIGAVLRDPLSVSYEDCRPYFIGWVGQGDNAAGEALLARVWPVALVIDWHSFNR